MPINPMTMVGFRVSQNVVDIFSLNRPETTRLQRDAAELIRNMVNHGEFGALRESNGRRNLRITRISTVWRRALN